MTNFKLTLEFNDGVLPEDATHYYILRFYKWVDGVLYVKMKEGYRVSLIDTAFLKYLKPITIDDVLSTLD